MKYFFRSWPRSWRLSRFRGFFHFSPISRQTRGFRGLRCRVWVFSKNTDPILTPPTPTGLLRTTSLFLHSSSLWSFVYLSNLFSRDGLRSKYQRAVFFFFRIFIQTSTQNWDPLRQSLIKTQSTLADAGSGAAVFTSGSEVVGYPYALLGLLVFSRHLPVVGSMSIPKLPQLNPQAFFFTLLARLSLSYFVQYKALDRKLRKIVKNKYRYSRQYVALLPHDRLRAGLRLLKITAFFFTARRWRLRFFSMMQSLLLPINESLVLTMVRRHQQTSLKALGLR